MQEGRLERLLKQEAYRRRHSLFTEVVMVTVVVIVTSVMMLNQNC